MADNAESIGVSQAEEGDDPPRAGINQGSKRRSESPYCTDQGDPMRKVESSSKASIVFCV